MHKYYNQAHHPHDVTLSHVFGVAVGMASLYILSALFVLILK